MLALAIFALLGTGLTACGSGDSEDSTSASTGGTGTEQATATSTSGDKGSEPSADFLTPGGDNSIQTFGEEADAAEVDAATAALTGYLRARAKDDWAKECSYLAAATVAPLEELASRSTRFKGKGCAAVLAELTAGTPSSTRVNTIGDGIASLRVEGDRGFALYHGPKGVDYFVPMTKEDGEWKVAALEPTAFP